MRTGTTGQCRRALRTGPASYPKHAVPMRLTMTKRTAGRQGHLAKWGKGRNYEAGWKEAALQTQNCWLW